MTERGPEEPIERKVQLTGGSTYTVSIPKAWATEQEIEPGSRVHVYTRPDRLVVARDDVTVDTDRYDATVTATGHSPADLARITTASYIAGCDELRIDGDLSAAQRRAVTEETTGLIGFETRFSEREGLTVRSMLDSSTLSLSQNLLQMKVSVLSMHEAAIEGILDADPETASRVESQDDAVDRLFSLLCRQFQRSLVDPATAISIDGRTTFEYYTAGRQLERIGDHAEKMAGIATRLTAPPSDTVATTLRDLSEQARRLVERVIDCLMNGNDIAELTAVITDAEDLVDTLTELDRDLYDRDVTDGYLLGTVVDSLLRTVEYGVNIAEAGLQDSMRGTHPLPATNE